MDSSAHVEFVGDDARNLLNRRQSAVQESKQTRQQSLWMPAVGRVLQKSLPAAGPPTLLAHDTIRLKSSEDEIDMNISTGRVQPRSWRTRACVVVTLGLSLGALSACDSLLEVDLPAQLGTSALEDPAGADTQLNSIITHFEGGYQLMVWDLFGHEDGGEIFSNVAGADFFQYFSAPSDAGVDPYDWFTQLMIARSFAEEFHGRLENDWTTEQVPDRAQYMAISKLYEAAVIGFAGQTMCEMAVDGGEKMTPAQAYAMAESLYGTAISEIASAGDFAMPLGVASSAETMAYGLRAQMRWMSGDVSGALADAQRVPQGFMAWVTREGTPARRNRAWWDGTNVQSHGVFGVNDWWSGLPNPATGQDWPNPIPFTGYNNLGILPDGRAVRDDGLPIRTEGDHRMAEEDAAVPDTRVRTILGDVQGVGPAYVNARYGSGDDDVPVVNWKEMWLIRAELEGGQRAIDLVNELREADNLPLVTYADPGDAGEILYMLIEERRRAMFLEGRYYPMKLRNAEFLWFPRGQGTTRWAANTIGGGVRFIMPTNEYVLNTNLELIDRATGCDAAVAPLPDLG